MFRPRTFKGEYMFKLNSNRKVIEFNDDLIKPKLSNKEATENIRSIAFTPNTLEKLEKLRAKYKISKSAIGRIFYLPHYSAPSYSR